MQHDTAHDLLGFFFQKPAEPVTLLSTTRDLLASTAKYVSTVTVSDCIPVSSLFHTDQSGWFLTRSVYQFCQKNPRYWVFGVSRPRAVQCRWFDSVFICVTPFSFFNGVVGLVDPAHFIPPTFCKGAKLEMQEPVHFYNLFDSNL